ncbi:MAG: preprotein translocase subunit YajC [Candidatus Poribacteria bacterium]|nr:MAG: preprotein translocase subunit YajC [Candidatus Poribacteria bacterium]
MDALVQFFPFILIFALFYFLIIRPQQQREKKHKRMLEGLKKGDIIVTQGGLIGRIEGFAEDGKVLIVRVAEGVKVEVLRSSVSFLKKAGELVEG